MLDRRMAARRRSVQEDGARRRLRRLLYVLAALAIVAAGIWLLLSPIMAVDAIVLHGAERSGAGPILAEAGVQYGVPTAGVRPGRVEGLLREDPWIIDADVSVTWPGSVEVVILEHDPVAWVATGRDWMLVSATGDILEVGTPVGDAPRIELLGTPLGRPGTVVDDPAAVGAALFVAGLPESARSGLKITGTGRGLWAEAGGHVVRLGRAVEMAEKAAALGAILVDDLQECVSIDLISPLWPALSCDSQPEVEGEETGLAEPQPEN